MAQTAKPEAEKAIDLPQGRHRQRRRTISAGVALTRRPTSPARPSTRLRIWRAVASGLSRGRLGPLAVERAVARRSAEGTAEAGQALTGLIKEQAQHNVETMSALTGVRSTGSRLPGPSTGSRLSSIQTGYLRVSMERMAQLTQALYEISQSVVTTATSAALRQADKAA